GYYFLRKESRLTTSPGFSPAGAGFAATGSGVSPAVGSGGLLGTITGPVGGLGAASPPARDWRADCPPGAQKAVNELNGICSGAGSFLKVSVTSKYSSFTFSAQYWCWMMMVISSGYCSFRNSGISTPSAWVLKVR